MGCHTWLYEKVENVPSDEILLKYYYKETYETIDSKGTYKKSGHYALKYFSEWQIPTHYKDQTWKRNRSKKKIIDINKVPKEIRHLFTPDDNFFESPDWDSNIHFDSTGFYKELKYGDIFRISGYPEVELHSYKEAEDFIMSSKVVEELPEGYDKFEGDYEDDPDKVLYSLSYRSDGQTKKSVLEIIRKFFDEHPNGLILFG